MEFDWHLTNRCNFDCAYCHPQIKTVLNRKDLNEPLAEFITTRFNELGTTCLIHMSGGEPFLFPDFVRLASGLTQQHFISINTNLSLPNVDTFATQIDPLRVVKIAAALHIEERERLNYSLDDFVNKVALLIRSGFPISILYILYPPLLSRAAADIATINRLGPYDLQAKVFKGIYQGQRYPEAYSGDARELVAELSGSYPNNQQYISGDTSFKGLDCSAGRNSFKILVNGEVRRCASVPHSYGNIYNGTFLPSRVDKPCTANRTLVLSQCLAYAESKASLKVSDKPSLTTQGKAIS